MPYELVPSPQGHPWALRGGVLAFALLVVAQIATPLVDSASEALTTTVVVTLAIATFLVATLRAEVKRILELFLVIAGIALIAEAIGIRTGLPFGHYQYTSLLQPQLLGVPVIVPVAWFAMGLPAWEMGRRLVQRPVLQWLVGGLLLAAWDLLLDPQMITAGYWTWDGAGFWQGIPLSNYLGWTLVGTIICACASRLLDHGETTVAPNVWLCLIYLWMGFFTALGFVLPFVFDRPLVGVVGGVAMVVPALLALRTYERPWLR